MRYLALVFIFLFFTACSLKKPISAKEGISDLLTLSQNSSTYLKEKSINGIDANEDSYEKKYFRVWNEIPDDTKDESMWPFVSYTNSEMYGENLQPIKEDAFKKLEDNANFGEYKSINKTAITLNHLDIRAFPTSKPMFKDPNIAGEGFPFDYVQNSTVSANKPVLISHYSKDEEWAFIFSSFTSGWVKSKDIITIDKKYTDAWQKAKQVFLLKDNIPMYDEKGNFLFRSRVGMMLALIEEDKDNYTVLSVSSYKNNQPNYHKTKISKDISSKGVLEFNNKNIQSIFDEVAKSKYGWGGMFGERDCSSTVRDIYAPFGLWLPRNSFQQSQVGKVISLENLDDMKKIELIKKEAKPFKTLLYKQGHILIYVGVYNGEIIALHNVWGIKTKQNSQAGRLVIGKSVYSSLKLGKEQADYDEESEILRNLKSINIIAN